VDVQAIRGHAEASREVETLAEHRVVLVYVMDKCAAGIARAKELGGGDAPASQRARIDLLDPPSLVPPVLGDIVVDVLETLATRLGDGHDCCSLVPKLTLIGLVGREPDEIENHMNLTAPPKDGLGLGGKRDHRHTRDDLSRGPASRRETPLARLSDRLAADESGP
jgi:hypothetical protein